MKSCRPFFSVYKMRMIAFSKMVASGNDFVVYEAGRHSLDYGSLARKICERKFGVGADGLLVLEKTHRADIRMRIFNADGSEAQMCGNGARCAALFVKSHIKPHASKIAIQTKAGIIMAQLHGENVKIKLTDPTRLKIEIPLKVRSRSLRVNFINTGVPHAVIFVEGLDKIDVKNLGREIRFHKQFAPKGTNVNFVEVMDRNSIRVRTYERGVEDETLACGTGSTASALIASFMLQAPGSKVVNAHTRSGEILKIYFKEKKDKFEDVWLEGKVKTVYAGVYYV